MYFITNRKLTLLKHSPSYHVLTTDPARDPEPVPGDCVTMDFKDNRISQSLHYCEDTKEKNVYSVVGSDSLLKSLKNRHKKCNFLFYVHGFNNLPDEVLDRARRLQEMCDRFETDSLEGVCDRVETDNLALTSVEVVPIIWPCDDDIGIIKDYWDDQRSAKKSALGFVRLLERFVDWRCAKEQKETPCFKRINILSHSMGNLLLMRTFAEWVEAHGSMPQLFRNIFMFAADIPNEALEHGQPGEAISDAARNVVVYYAGDDMAMSASKMANLKNREVTRRLGHTGPEDMGRVPGNVHAVDCDEFNNKADGLKGHTYFYMDVNGTAQPTPAFTHMFRTMTSQSGRVDLSMGQVDMEQRNIRL